MALPGYKSFPLGLPDPAVAQSTALTAQATCLRCREGWRWSPTATPRARPGDPDDAARPLTEAVSASAMMGAGPGSATVLPGEVPRKVPITFFPCPGPLGHAEFSSDLRIWIRPAATVHPFRNGLNAVSERLAKPPGSRSDPGGLASTGEATTASNPRLSSTRRSSTPQSVGPRSP
jgi:hypothetical protein